MPAYILESVLEAVPRASRLRPGGRSWLGLAGQRALAVGFVGAAVVIAVVGAPLVINAPRSTSPAVVGGSPISTPTPASTPIVDASPSLAPTQGKMWNPASDYRRFPNQQNPSPDSHGNADVWSYGYSAGRGHDPSLYELFSDYERDPNRWYKPGFEHLTIGTPDVGIQTHPWRTGPDIRSIVLGWRSPVAGNVSLTGLVRLNDGNCTALGSGIEFSIDQGAGTLYSALLPSGGIQTFELTVTVSPRDSLYFIVDPGADSSCDSTLLWLVIRAA